MLVVLDVLQILMVQDLMIYSKLSNSFREYESWGATGNNKKIGDGAGLKTQIPHKLRSGFYLIIQKYINKNF